ncbi:MAG: hypothetical protein IJX51_03810 [Clostridia bacterium]|nr:hypothetical protein [Clostridia bacterium]
MKKTILNGTQIDYDTSLEKLKKMISSPVMKDFCLACEVLSSKNSVEAYEIMKPYVNDKDKYRRLYTLKTIFAFSQAKAELISFLENSILSDDILFSENALLVISNYEIKVSDALIISAVHRHMPKLYHALNTLKAIDVNEENYIKVIELFNKSNQSGQKEIIGNILMEKYLPAKACELFEIFRIDKYPKIRLLSVELARKYGYNLIQLMKDIDGHVRSHAIGSMGRLSFLSKYIGIYNIDISDDLESAIIYNPYSNNHIYI